MQCSFLMKKMKNESGIRITIYHEKDRERAKRANSRNRQNRKQKRSLQHYDR